MSDEKQPPRVKVEGGDWVDAELTLSNWAPQVLAEVAAEAWWDDLVQGPKSVLVSVWIGGTVTRWRVNVRMRPEFQAEEVA